MYKKISAVKAPILASITELGQTQLFTAEELRSSESRSSSIKAAKRRLAC